MKRKNDNNPKQHGKEDLGFLDDRLQLLDTVRQMISIELDRRGVNAGGHPLPEDTGHTPPDPPPCHPFWQRIVSFFTGSPTGNGEMQETEPPKDFLRNDPSPTEGTTQVRPRERPKPDRGNDPSPTEGTTQARPRERPKPDRGNDSSPTEGTTQARPRERLKPDRGNDPSPTEGTTQARPRERPKPDRGNDKDRTVNAARAAQV